MDEEILAPCDTSLLFETRPTPRGGARPARPDGGGDAEAAPASEEVRLWAWVPLLSARVDEEATRDFISALGGSWRTLGRSTRYDPRVGGADDGHGWWAAQLRLLESMPGAPSAPPSSAASTSPPPDALGDLGDLGDCDADAEIINADELASPPAPAHGHPAPPRGQSRRRAARSARSWTTCRRTTSRRASR